MPTTTITMYNFPMSPPCRTVRMTAKILGIDLKLVDLDLFNKEHKKQWFENINPICLVPTIDDKGFYLGESVAIMRYLVDQYAPDHALYPKDIKKRAIIDWLLDFNISTLFKALSMYLEDVMFKSQAVKPERMDEFNKKVAILEEFLGRSPYVAGDHMTIADLSVITSLDFAEIVMDHSYSDFPKVEAWLNKLKKEIPNYKEINVKALKDIKENHNYKKS